MFDQFSADTVTEEVLDPSETVIVMETMSWHMKVLEVIL